MYYVMIADHTGDMRGKDWYTGIICYPLTPQVPNLVLTKSVIIDPQPGSVKLNG